MHAIANQSNYKMKINNDKAKEIREDFPIFKRRIHGKPLVYLDNAATTQKPICVIEAIKNFYTNENANIHRGVYTLSEEATVKYDKAHSAAGELINAYDDEIVFTRNTTESINLLSYSLPSILNKKRKDIVLTEMEHHSNLVPWQQLAKRMNMKLKFIKVKDDLTLDYEDAEKLITDNTAILSFTHISNAIGSVNDENLLVKLGKKNGAITIMDAAQSVPNMPIDVKSLSADFVAFSAHKMIGPTGLGVLYGRKNFLENMDPFNFGGDMISSVSYTNAQWNKVPEKFEAGTQNISGAIGFNEAVKYLQKIGMNNICTWEKELKEYALENLKKLKNIKLFSPAGKCGAIISFEMGKIHAHDVASLLSDENICIRGGHHCAMPLMHKLGVAGTSRASLYFYNTFEDIDKLCESLKKVDGVFSGVFR